MVKSLPTSLLLLFAPSGLAVSDDALAILEAQQLRMRSGLRAARESQLHAFDHDICSCRSSAADETPQPMLLDNWVNAHCNGWGEDSRCVGRIVQDVKHFAPFEQILDLAGGNFTERAVKVLKRQAAGYYAEHEDTLKSIANVISTLKGESRVEGVTDAEVADRIRESRRFHDSPDRTVAFQVGFPEHAGHGTFNGLNKERYCSCFAVSQARTLWDDAPDTARDEQGPIKIGVFAGVPDFAPEDISWPSGVSRMITTRRQNRLIDDRRLKGLTEEQELELEKKLEEEDDPEFEKIVDLAAEHYAKHNRAMTWSFLLLTMSGAMAWEPSCDSGPLLPEYTCASCGSHYAPCSDVYHQGFSWPFAVLGICYVDSCPYGLFTCCPGLLGYSVANPCGRQWPERTVFGSHPSGSSSNSDGHQNNDYIAMYEAAQKKKDARRLGGSEENERLYGSDGGAFLYRKTGDRVFIAPERNVYDARLVEALHGFADQGATINKVTVFTTRLIQLKLIGLNPSNSAYQHFGLTLELSHPVDLDGKPVHFVTFEMMSNGMMWTLGEHSEPSKDRYDYLQKSTMQYDNLSPREVARYITGQRGRKYRYTQVDCQTIALELAQRLALHGRRLHVEWKNEHTQTIDKHFFVVLPVAIFLVCCLLWLGAKHIRKLSGSARSPAFSNAMTACALGLSLLTGTVAAPLVVGGWWYMKRRAQPADESLQQAMEETPAEEGVQLANAVE